MLKRISGGTSVNRRVLKGITTAVRSLIKQEILREATKSAPYAEVNRLTVKHVGWDGWTFRGRIEKYRLIGRGGEKIGAQSYSVRGMYDSVNRYFMSYFEKLL